MKNSKKYESEVSDCPHKHTKKEGGFVVCQDCGLTLEEGTIFEDNVPLKGDYYSDSQRDYERKIKISDSKALQDPKIKEKYDRIKTLEKWFRDYESDFTEQKKTIELLKSYRITINTTVLLIKI